jgi:ComF family protein
MRRRTRGYNQAELLARELSKNVDIPVTARVLNRARPGPAQARTSSVASRAANVAEAFRVPQPGLVAGTNLLLVDDVTTTGATLAECARVLKEAGARAVWALSFARED